MKRFAFLSFAIAGLSAAAEPLPTVSDVTLRQSAATAEITYALDRAPAIVTLSLLVDGVEDAELASGAHGDVFKVVTAAGRHSIAFRPRKTKLRDQVATNVVAKVTAWSLERPPDYMVVDLAENSFERVRYYASTNALPGGLFANSAYRTSKLVMRLIRAKGVEWEMGGGCENAYITANSSNADFPAKDTIHPVELGVDYWMGVFELTQSQYREITGSWCGSFSVEREYRPVDSIRYTTLRLKNSQGDDTLSYYPAAPGDQSFLGLLRARTGLDFDLPGEAQWEFACRAGTGIGEFNTGLGYARDDHNYGLSAEYKAAFPGRVYWTQAKPTATAGDYGVTNGTAAVGSYAPNRFGLYDMHGNVREWCLDWYAVDITGLNGAINASGAFLADGGTVPPDSRHVVRGGHWAGSCDLARSGAREKGRADSDSDSGYGFRVCCPLVTAGN